MPPDDLNALFLAQCDKLTRLTAALGFPGDEPVEKLVGLARELRRDAESIRKLRRFHAQNPDLTTHDLS